jgi:hypothetical protein
MWHVWVSSFGVTAAILSVGGYVFLQWQRNRHRFRLMQTALERGTTELCEGPPFWLVSLRQGVAVLVLGMGLMAAGAAAFTLAQGVEMPEALTVQSTGDSGAWEEAASPTHEAAKPKPGRPKPPPSPALERWRRAQDQETVGLAAIGCGFLIALLGGVRTAFAFVERKHFRTARQAAC